MKLWSALMREESPPSALVYTRRTTRSKPRFNLINLVGIIGGAPQVGAITAAEMATYSPQPTRTQPGSRGASTSGVGAPAATPPVVSLTCEQRSKL